MASPCDRFLLKTHEGNTGCNGVYLWQKSLTLNGVQTEGLFHLSEGELTVRHCNPPVVVYDLHVRSIVEFMVG